MSSSGPDMGYRLVCLTTRMAPLGAVVEHPCAECETAVWVSWPNLSAVTSGEALPTCVGCVRALAVNEDFRWMFGPEEERFATVFGILGELRKQRIMLAAGTMTPIEHLDKIVGDRW